MAEISAIGHHVEGGSATPASAQGPPVLVRVNSLGLRVRGPSHSHSHLISHHHLASQKGVCAQDSGQRYHLPSGCSMDDDDSYLYGDSNQEEVAQPAAQPSGKSLDDQRRGSWPRHLCTFVLSAMKIS